MIKSASNFKSQKNEKIELFLIGTCYFQNLWNKTLVTTDYEYVEVSSFARLDLKL